MRDNRHQKFFGSPRQGWPEPGDTPSQTDEYMYCHCEQREPDEKSERCNKCHKPLIV
jgi:hypothetical protein